MASAPLVPAEAPGPEPRTLAVVGSTGHWAGAQSTLHSLLGALDTSRWSPHVVLPNNGRFQSRLEDLGVPVRFARSVVWIDQRGARTWERFGAGLAGRVEALAEHLYRQSPALVYSNSSVVLEGALAAKRLGVPHVWRVHEMLTRHDNFGPALPLSIYPALLDALSDRVSVVSTAVQDVLTPGVAASRIRVVPNGLATPRPIATGRAERLGFAPDGPVVIFVGTVSESKGVPALAGVMRRVLKRFPKARCVLVGRDVGGKKKLLAKARGIEGAFSFTGFAEDATDRIAAADALILPSKVDSLPCVVMEAMAAGVPSVATRSGGASDLIVDGESGFLTAIGDEAAMADRLCRLFEDDTLQAAMGRAAEQRLASHFSLEGYAERTMALFDEVLDAPDPAPPQSDVDALIGHLERAAGERTSRAAERAVMDSLEAIRRPPPPPR